MIALSLTTGAMGENEFKEQAQKMNSLYRTGMQAVQKGDGATARKAFQAMLKIDPNNGHARYQLGQLNMKLKKGKKSQRKALFDTTKIAAIDFEDATLQEVLEALNLLAIEATNQKFIPNFIIHDPKEILKNSRITLKLKNVPLSVALRYTLEQAAATIQYDSEVTVIRPAARVGR